MKNLILWSIAALTYFIATYPTLVLSEKDGARLARGFLDILLACVLGYGVGSALAGVLLK